MRQVLRSGRVLVGGGVVLVILLACIATLWWTARAASGSRLYFDRQASAESRLAPQTGSLALSCGTDKLGRSMLGRALLGGVLSLGIGVMAAITSVCLGLSIGLLAGYAGSWVDHLLMRIVDVLYGLPFVLMVVLLKVALEGPFSRLFAASTANLVVLCLSIGLVSWLTMARVVRGQVLSLRGQPFIEAAQALGLPHWRIFLRHLLPNLAGPVLVYATMIVPQAILQESFLSFLGIGIQPPLPTWGGLAGEGLVEGLNPVLSRWWLLVVPCALLAVTLLSLNFLGDGLRDVLDPRRDQAKL
jgi:ABC-type dipeptide/oligopeptide/nickel transport system permease subunit